MVVLCSSWCPQVKLTGCARGCASDASGNCRRIAVMMIRTDGIRASNDFTMADLKSNCTVRHKSEAKVTSLLAFQDQIFMKTLLKNKWVQKVWKPEREEKFELGGKPQSQLQRCSLLEFGIISKQLGEADFFTSKPDNWILPRKKSIQQNTGIYTNCGLTGKLMGIEINIQKSEQHWCLVVVVDDLLGAQKQHIIDFWRTHKTPSQLLLHVAFLILKIIIFSICFYV